MTWEQKREKSYSYLNRYKDEISSSTYFYIKQTIGSHAIEDMFLSEDEIYNLICVGQGKITTDSLIAKYIHNAKAS